MEPELENLENTQPIHISKKAKVFSRETMQGATAQQFAKEITDLLFVDPATYTD